ncbi:MAG: hypothetical protein C5B43_01270 [Verrucomicrobia bacterium]|nr:MAG: hypothetical protein C5B43_01270 [Verrucomicrobiota bacterium]
MLENHLELPYIAVIPYNVQIDTRLSDSAKLYYGQIIAFAKKTGYMWATDQQLADMKGVSKRSIERWNHELESAGHIKRVTANVPVKAKNGDFGWIKKRKIYFNEGFGFAKPAESEKIPETEETEQIDSAENGVTIGSAENGVTIGSAENGGININLLDKSLKKQCDAPEAVVVFPSLSKLDIETSLAVKICNEHSQQEVDLAVERCLRWKSRPSDSVGIMTTLSRADTWSDNPTPEEKQESNLEHLKNLRHLDGKIIASTSITVGNKYVEFVRGMKILHITIDDPEFKKKIVDQLEYLNRMEEAKK